MYYFVLFVFLVRLFNVDRKDDEFGFLFRLVYKLLVHLVFYVNCLGQFIFNSLFKFFCLSQSNSLSIKLIGGALSRIASLNSFPGNCSC